MDSGEQENLIALVRKRAAIVQEGTAFYGEMTDLADAIAETPENQEMFIRELGKKTDLVYAIAGVWLELASMLMAYGNEPGRQDGDQARTE